MREGKFKKRPNNLLMKNKEKNLMKNKLTFFSEEFIVRRT